MEGKKRKGRLLLHGGYEDIVGSRGGGVEVEGRRNRRRNEEWEL